jgi:hypothetical protein
VEGEFEGDRARSVKDRASNRGSESARDRKRSEGQETDYYRMLQSWAVLR